MPVEEPQQDLADSARHPQTPPAAACAYRSLTICRILSESISFMLEAPSILYSLIQVFYHESRTDRAYLAKFFCLPDCRRSIFPPAAPIAAVFEKILGGVG
jgi:hypothetical protein